MRRDNLRCAIGLSVIWASALSRNLTHAPITGRVMSNPTLVAAPNGESGFGHQAQQSNPRCRDDDGGQQVADNPNAKTARARSGRRQRNKPPPVVALAKTKIHTAERPPAARAPASRAAPCADRDQGGRAAGLAPLLVCVLLAGCAGASEETLIFGEAGKYQYHNCE